MFRAIKGLRRPKIDPLKLREDSIVLKKKKFSLLVSQIQVKSSLITLGMK